MQPKKNNNGADKGKHSPDPYVSGLLRSQRRQVDRGYSEAIRSVMDEMNGTATSRRAELYNSLR